MDTGTKLIQLTVDSEFACGGVDPPSPTIEHEALPPLPDVPAPPPARSPALLYLSSLLTHDSRRSQGSALRVVARLFGYYSSETLPWHALGPQHTAALRLYLATRHAPSTANRYLTAVREVLRRARRLGQLTQDELEAALDFRSVPGSREPPGRALCAAELERLFRAARHDTKRRRGARDAAIVALLYGGGLRRAEVAGVDLKDYDGEKVRVIGKGNKQRDVYLPEGALRALDAWLRVRGRAPGPLIDNLYSPGSAIHPDAVNELLERLRRRAGVEKFTPHDGRRSYATHLFDAGERLEVIQDCMGHASPATTARYRRDKHKARKRSAKLLTVPY